MYLDCQVPFESLRRSVRDHKYVIEEMNNVVSSINKNASNTTMTPAQRVQDIDKLISKLTRLKRKVSLGPPADSWPSANRKNLRRRR